MVGFIQDRFEAVIAWANGLETADGRLAALTLEEICKECKDLISTDEFEAS